MKLVHTAFAGIAFSMAGLTITALSGFLPAAFADPGTQVFTLTTDAQSNGSGGNLSCIFYAVENAVGLEGFTYVCDDTHSPFPFSLDQVEQGVVVRNDPVLGKPAVKLKADPGFDAVHGGPLTLSYLHSVVSGEWDDYSVEVHPTSAGQWEIASTQNGQNQVFTQIFLEKNTFLGKTIGIKGVQIK